MAIVVRLPRSRHRVTETRIGESLDAQGRARVKIGGSIFSHARYGSTPDADP
jgi:hypothetical protein